MLEASTDILYGPCFVLGDDVNTDLNCSGKYLPGKDEAFIGAQAFEAVAPGFAQRFQSGGIIVAGKHFGINSSREQAVHILRRMGVAAIVAPSFGRQFFRNAINNGLPVLECDIAGITARDELMIDLNAHTLQVAGQPTVHELGVMPVAIRAILREGGLIPFLRKYPDWEVTA
ncbi:MAG: 3-isopropylmalate dehydratase [Polaromonas sp.]|nr:3-isopropylmalate dehydratase [Polaromonas sp.]